MNAQASALMRRWVGMTLVLLLMLTILGQSQPVQASLTGAPASGERSGSLATGAPSVSSDTAATSYESLVIFLTAQNTILTVPLWLVDIPLLSR